MSSLLTRLKTGNCVVALMAPPPFTLHSPPPPLPSCFVKWSMCWSAFISIHPAPHLYSWRFAGAIQLNCLAQMEQWGDWGFGWSALTIGMYHALTYVYMCVCLCKGRIREIFVKTQPLKSEVEYEQVISNDRFDLWSDQVTQVLSC